MSKKKCTDGRRNNKPPKHTQFKKGLSGNPSGRPKSSGQKRLYSEEEIWGLFAEEGIIEINVREGDEIITIDKIRALVKKLYQQASGGCVKSMKIVLEKNEKAGAVVSEYLKNLMHYEIEMRERILSAPTENARKRIEVEEHYINSTLFISARSTYGEEAVPYQDWEPKSSAELEALKIKYQDRFRLWPN